MAAGSLVGDGCIWPRGPAVQGPLVSKGAFLLLVWGPGLLQGAQLGWLILFEALNTPKERIWLQEASYEIGASDQGGPVVKGPHSLQRGPFAIALGPF